MKIKVIGLFLMLIVIGTQAHAAFDLQARMEKVYLNHQSKSYLKDMVKGSDKGLDIHSASVGLARENAVVSIKDSIDMIINNFRSSNNCALNYNDAATLLVKNKKFKRFLNWIKDANSDFVYKIDDSAFVTSCVRYLNCINPVKKTNNKLSTDEYSRCTNDISMRFEQYFSTQYGKNQIENYSYGDEIFTNGSLEDSNFDLMYDIEQINKILYANPKRIPTQYLWGPPNYLSKSSTLPQSYLAATSKEKSTATQQYSNIATLLIPVKLYAGNSPVPNIEDAIQQIQDNQNPDSNIVSNLQCFDPAPIILSDDAKIFKEEVQKIKQGNLNLAEDKILDDVIATVSQPFDDVPITTPGSDLPPELLNPIVEDQILVEDRGGEPTPPGTDPNNSSTSNSNCPVNQQNTTLNDASWSEIADVTSKKLSVGQCLGQCLNCGEGPAKRACYRKCLCRSFTNENQYGSGISEGLLGTDIGMKLCLIPSTTPDIITPGTQIVSIQEIINQIGAVLAKLRASGQYIPSSKSSEFFSPTTKVGKLTNLLNFNINVSSKSRYRTPDKKTETDIQKNYFDTQIPDIGQLQISSILRQNQGYADFIDIHQEFRDQMKLILDDRNNAAQNFYNQIK